MARLTDWTPAIATPTNAPMMKKWVWFCAKYSAKMHTTISRIESVSERLPPKRSCKFPKSSAPSTFVACTMMKKMISPVCCKPNSTAPRIAAKSSAMITPSL